MGRRRVKTYENRWGEIKTKGRNAKEEDEKEKVEEEEEKGSGRYIVDNDYQRQKVAVATGENMKMNFRRAWERNKWAMTLPRRMSDKQEENDC